MTGRWTWLTLLLAMTALVQAGERPEQTASEPEEGRSAAQTAPPGFPPAERWLIIPRPASGRDWTPAERALLLLAQEAELLHASFGPDRLEITYPDPEADEVRAAVRGRLESWLGIPLLEWPASKGLHLPADLHAADRCILLIHGLHADVAHLTRLQEACTSSGLKVLVFDYPHNSPIAWCGARLAEELRQLHQRIPGLRLTIVGHSMGGLVAREALERTPTPPVCVTQLITLGTPHQGSELAEWEDWSRVVDEMVAQRWRPADLLREGLGEAGQDLRPGSRFLETLNRRPRPAGIRYHVAAGRRGVCTDREAERMIGALRSAAEGGGLSVAAGERLIQLLESDELRTGRGDGAVSLTSALLPDATTQQVFDVNHEELLSLPGGDPRESEVFMWIQQLVAPSEERP